ncbi:hypothetical protein [Aegicerativicinus sediminis]|uniref:hypothetical protein n=1 Tax=Aegicerativicinus sediminis TaxID=2893202 RepID=UPI001E4684DF|nr:hypothetical protein [Aegicerativicinus sediminis]
MENIQHIYSAVDSLVTDYRSNNINLDDLENRAIHLQIQFNKIDDLPKYQLFYNAYSNLESKVQNVLDGVRIKMRLNRGELA